MKQWNFSDDVQAAFVDTNVFLEIALNQAKAETCQRLLEELKDRPIVTTDFALYSMALIILRKTKDPQVVRYLLQTLEAMTNLQIHRPSAHTIQKALEIMSQGYSFDDALVLATMRALDIQILASLDADFDNAPNIKNVLRQS